MQPHRSRYWLNANPDDPEAFARQVATVCEAYEQAARVYSTENAYARLTNPKAGTPVPSALWPTDSFAASLKTLFVTGEPIEMIHQPSAHTDGDLIVFFRK